MNQPAIQNGASPPWLFLGGLLLGALLLGFLAWDSIGPSKHSTSAQVIELTDANWKIEVVESRVPVMVDFWGKGCPPCKKLAPIIDKLAETYQGKLKVGKLNVHQNGEISQKYGIQSIPCVMFFKGGEKPVQVFVGFRDEPTLVAAINQVLAAD